MKSALVEFENQLKNRIKSKHTNLCASAKQKYNMSTEQMDQSEQQQQQPVEQQQVDEVPTLYFCSYCNDFNDVSSIKNSILIPDVRRRVLRHQGNAPDGARLLPQVRRD